MTTQTDEWGTVQTNDFEMDGAGVSGEDLGGAGAIRQEGWYHLEITDVVPELETVNKKGGEKSPCVRMDMTVLEQVKGQAPVGAKHFHRLYVGAKGGGPAAEGSRNNVLRFCLGLGICKEVEANGQKSIVDAATGSSRINFETLKRAKGKQCIAKIELQRDEKHGDKYEIPFSRVAAVDDPSVADVPKNAAALKMIGMGHVGTGKAGGSGGGGTGKGKATPPADTKPVPKPPVDNSPGISDADLADL